MKKVKGPEECYLNWGGWHVTEDTNPEVYERLPMYWKQWKAEIHNAVFFRRPQPTLASLERQFPGPGKPTLIYDSEITLRLLKNVVGKAMMLDLIKEYSPN